MVPHYRGICWLKKTDQKEVPITGGGTNETTVLLLQKQQKTTITTTSAMHWTGLLRSSKFIR